jgi:hypothetical protein
MKVLNFFALTFILCINTPAFAHVITAESQALLCHSAPSVDEYYRLIVVPAYESGVFEVYGIRGDSNVSEAILTTFAYANNAIVFSSNTMSLKVSTVNPSRYPSMYPNAYESNVEFATFSNGLTLNDAPVECEVLMEMTKSFIF